MMNASPNPARGRHGMATAPNALAAQSAMAVLREGGNAVEAMVAAAAGMHERRAGRVHAGRQQPVDLAQDQQRH